MNIYIDTLGCPKNSNDSELAAGILVAAGHTIVNEPLGSDVIMVNTCGFINDAKQESIDKIFEMATLKKEEGLLIVSGCLAQRYGETLFKEIPEVDIFLGVNEYGRLPEILKQHVTCEREKHLSGYDREFLESAERYFSENPYTATIKVAEGCNNVCAYCVIPSIRGSYRSRRLEDILAEAEKLAQKGCKELILIAQDVTAYGIDLYGELKLAELVEQLCKIKKLQWIRLMYCYEDRITDDLIAVMAREEKVCKYLDIPIQHASDKILKAMNRRSTNKSICSTINKLRKAMPDIHIRTTLITGFPGETKDAFDELLDFVETMKFERLGVFAYSKEEGTAAATMKGQIRSDIKEKRKEAIMRRQLDISLAANQGKIGKIFEVFVEGMEVDGTYFGRTRFDAPEIDNSVLFTSHNQLEIGDIIYVKITDAFDYDLVGEHQEEIKK